MKDWGGYLGEEENCGRTSRASLQGLSGVIEVYGEEVESFGFRLGTICRIGKAIEDELIQGAKIGRILEE